MCSLPCLCVAARPDGYRPGMKREEQWQEQGGGEQTDEGGPSGADIDVDGPNESAPGSGDEEGDFPTEAA